MLKCLQLPNAAFMGFLITRIQRSLKQVLGLRFVSVPLARSSVPQSTLLANDGSRLAASLPPPLTSTSLASSCFWKTYWGPDANNDPGILDIKG